MAGKDSEKEIVRLEDEGDALIVSPLVAFSHMLDPSVARQWKAVLDRLDDPSLKRLVVDLGDLPYFGSLVLDWLVQLWIRIRAHGGSMAVCNVNSVGREVLTLARLDTLWRVSDSRGQALAELAVIPPRASPSQP
jgi:anti-sigma B factor antagonist